MAELRVDILTLFPDTVNAMLHESILGRAAKKGILDLRCTQIRDYTENRQCQVDDYPYGGGFGCVMMAQPLKSCLDAVLSGAETRSGNAAESDLSLTAGKALYAGNCETAAAGL